VSTPTLTSPTTAASVDAAALYAAAATVAAAGAVPAAAGLTRCVQTPSHSFVFAFVVPLMLSDVLFHLLSLSVSLSLSLLRTQTQFNRPPPLLISLTSLYGEQFQLLQQQQQLQHFRQQQQQVILPPSLAHSAHLNARLIHLPLRYLSTISITYIYRLVISQSI
jgi:hypothetical protein